MLGFFATCARDYCTLPARLCCHLWAIMRPDADDIATLATLISCAAALLLVWLIYPATVILFFAGIFAACASLWLFAFAGCAAFPFVFAAGLLVCSPVLLPFYMVIRAAQDADDRDQKTQQPGPVSH